MTEKAYVIGAGVTGLSFAKVFDETVEVLESRSDLGGKALSYEIETTAGIFRFDTGGHWFHHKNVPEALELLKGLELEEHKRYAYVWLDNQFLEFPIQQSYKNHTNLSFVKNVEKDFKIIWKNEKSYGNYNEMLLKSYGSTLYESFFQSYNSKMFGIRDLSQINVESYERVRNVRISEEIQGYNSDFVYPKGELGAKAIPMFLAENVKIGYNKNVDSISLSEKSMAVNNENVNWNKIISTMPLKSLVATISDIDPEISKLAKELKSSKGMILNLGVKRCSMHGNKSWVYIPSLDYSFYRVGFYSNIQPVLAPADYVSMYVECSPLFFKSKEEAFNLMPKVIDELIQAGFIERKEDIVTSQVLYLEHNYCLPNSKVSEKIRDYLAEFQIYSIGRYGTWHWSSQHEDMQQAIQLAKTLSVS